MNVRHVDDARREADWVHLLRTSFGAIRRDPAATWPITVAALRFARRGWWHRAPFLPLPDERYWRFRMETAYGDEDARVSAHDVAEAARWSRRARSARR